MSYKVIQIDPRPASKEAMIDLLKGNAPVWGVEFTLLALSQYIEFNLDGQHVEGGSGKAAIELAAISLPPAKATTLAVVRPDADALGAIAVLNITAERWDKGEEGYPPEMIDRIDLIAKFDKFAMGPWVPQPLESRELSEDQKIFKSISACCLDFKASLEDRIARVEKWLVSGDFSGFESYQGKVISELDQAISESKVQENDGVAIVESRNIGATSIGYAVAPIVIIRNDAFRFQGGEPHVKYTICQWREGYINFDALKVKLNSIEEAKAVIRNLVGDLEEVRAYWGGSKTILGSPQGVSSTLTLEQVEQAVRDCKLVTCNDHGMTVLQEDLNEHGNCK
jgi:hypothetical protein